MRLYYLFDDISAVKQISTYLHQNRIKDSRIHIFSADEAGLYKYRLHSASPLQTRELIRYGEEGGLIGLIVGAALALVLVYSLNFLRAMPMVAFAVVTAIIAAHGAWLGGMVGLATMNRRLKKFLPEVQAGRHLVMIDLPQARCEEIVTLVRTRFQQEPRDEANSIVLPFIS